MRTLKDAFEKEYEAYEEPANNKRGFRIKYRYKGPLYVIKFDRKMLQIIKVKMAVLEVLCVVCFIIGATSESIINYYSLSVALATAAVGALIFEFIGVVCFLTSKEQLKLHEYEQIEFMLKIVPVIYGVLLLIASVTGFLIDSMVAILYGLSGVFSIAVFILYRQVQYEKRW